ncbi:arabinogalactan endo-1,4-beta-galactosidase [Aeromonas sp. RU39B]|uniref:glycoside hydrolase family 53 protein n=1 Tax=Aeromonas sp. RU39B TaxID=1907416 RepID=UPI000953ACB9|nr:glycosyl hydrolase 53 family protein [Aeromonas sp. RU39B]SIR66382.1 arabinogalactan endo-1,4-beta-galactosidase [Aeromonas sp. RU39B]
MRWCRRHGPILAMLGALGAGAGISAEAATPLAIRGADISSLAELEARGVHYRKNGHEYELMQLLKSEGLNLVRLRLWVDPYSKQGEPFGGGTTDLAQVMALAKRAKALGLPWLLDLHYSDFWADPGKQFTPRAWQQDSPEQLARHMHDYTESVMQSLRKADLMPAMVQVGNELNNGLLWPIGRLRQHSEAEFDQLANLLRSAIDGLRSGSDGVPMSRIVLHLAEGGDKAQCLRWFAAMQARDVPFDVLALSFYPYWHGTLGQLKENMLALAEHFHRPLLVVETAYGFTRDNADGVVNGFGAAEEEKGGYPATPAGQLAFLDDLRRVIGAVPQGLGFVYWEPAWLRVPGDTWATTAGLRFLGINGPQGNSWENQALFDFHGEGLPALAAFAPYR